MVLVSSGWDLLRFLTPREPQLSLRAGRDIFPKYLLCEFFLFHQNTSKIVQDSKINWYQSIVNL